jgi:hypothetical protein
VKGKVSLEFKVEQTTFKLLAKNLHARITYLYGKTLASKASSTLYIIYYLRIQNKNLLLIIVSKVWHIYNVNPVVMFSYIRKMFPYP